MVDFQSRDTSRGYGDDGDEDDEEEPADANDDEVEAESKTEADSVTETPDDAGTDTDEGDVDDEAVGEGTETPEHGESGVSAAEDDAGTEMGSDPLAPEQSDSPAAKTDESSASETHDPAGSESSDPLAPSESQSVERATGTGAPEHESDHRQGTEQQDHGHAHHEGQGHADDHRHSHDHAHGADVGLLGVAVVTVSSTRTREDDTSGDVIEAVVEAADHEVVTREILRDDLDGVQTALLNLTGRDDVDVVVTTGGTGVTPDDVTVEAARPLFDRELPGFGELFRILSYEEIGTRAMVSRATAGMVDGVPVFCLPGSEAAARLGTEELVVEEMGHLVSLARRDD